MKIKNPIVCTTLFFILLLVFINHCTYQAKSKFVHNEYLLLDERIELPTKYGKIILNKIDDKFLNETDSLKIEKWKIINSNSILLPDSICGLFKQTTPFSPTNDFRFYVDKLDSVKFSLSSNEKDANKIELLNRLLSKGYYLLELRAMNIKSGVYFINCTIGTKSQSKKLLLLK
jgi:hypothetical protein